MAKPDKFFGQVGNDSFSPAIEMRRNALNEGGDLRDFHDDLVFSLAGYQRVQCSKVPRHSGKMVLLATKLTEIPKGKRSGCLGEGAGLATGSRLDFGVTPHQDVVILRIEAGSQASEQKPGQQHLSLIHI